MVKNSNVSILKNLMLISGVVLCSNPLLAEEIPCPEPQSDSEPAVKKVRVREKDEVILKSGDGKCFVLKEDDTKQSQTITNLIEDSGINDPIPLANIDGETLKIVVEMLKEKKKKVADIIGESFAFPPFTCSKDNQLVKLIFAANYLDIQPILAAGTEFLGKKIFVQDLVLLNKKSQNEYQQYSTCLEHFPKDIQRLMVQKVALTPFLRAIFGHGSKVSFQKLSPNGTRLLTYSKTNGIAKLWDASARGDRIEPLSVMQLGNRGDLDVAFSSDGTRLLTCLSDCSRAELWDANPKGKPPTALATFRDENRFDGGVFNPDGTRVLTRAYGTAKLWDANTQGEQNAPLATFMHDDDVFSAIFSPDGTKVLTMSGDKTVKLWNANAQGEDVAPLVTFLHEHYPVSFAFSPDGTRVVTGDSFGFARLWNANAPDEDVAPLATLRHFVRDVDDNDDQAGVKSVEFSPDGALVLTGASDGSAKLWDANARVDTDTALATFRHFVRVDKDSDNDNDSDEDSYSTPDGMYVYSVEFSPNGARVLTRSYDGIVKLWNAMEQGEINEPLATFPDAFVDFMADGTMRLIKREENTVKLLEFMDVQKLASPLAETQIMLFVQKNKLTKAKTPAHLVAELSDYAKNFLWGE